jgi:hypothetical protein
MGGLNQLFALFPQAENVYNHNLYFKRIVKEVGVPMSQMESIASSAVSTIRLFRPNSGPRLTGCLESKHTYVNQDESRELLCIRYGGRCFCKSYSNRDNRWNIWRT